MDVPSLVKKMIYSQPRLSEDFPLIKLAIDRKWHKYFHSTNAADKPPSNEVGLSLLELDLLIHADTDRQTDRHSCLTTPHLKSLA